jgi:methyl-accepting chemotaxis protein
VWKDLTDNVNFMASNLTKQVRGIVKVVTAVANGDLSQKLIGVEAKGEIAALAETINNMCDTLGTFADQVTTVAREVGIEGKLGGQAKVPGAMGTWRAAHRQRQSARRQPHVAGARHLRRGHGGRRRAT